MIRARTALRVAALPLAVVSAVVVVRSLDLGAVSATWRSLLADPGGLFVAVGAYGLAFALRAWIWNLLVPSLGWGHSWSAIHLGLAANHLLPVRLGEAVRPIAAAKRTPASLASTTASTIAMRSADVLAVAGLAILLAPSLVTESTGAWMPGVVAAVVAAWFLGFRWLRRLPEHEALPLGSLSVMVVAVCGWFLESAVMWRAASWAGIDLSYLDAVLVTAVTIAAQIFAVAPGGLGTYEAAGTAAMVGLGAAPGAALAAVFSAHALKTAYSLLTGAIALFFPAPGALGRLRLAPRSASTHLRQDAVRVRKDAPVVLFLPAYNEARSVAAVVRRAPDEVLGRRVIVAVIDDGSTDATAETARSAGAVVVSLDRNRGLGAAVREGLQAASAYEPAAIAFCDADGEYSPEELGRLVAPIVEGTADYVVGSRFSGNIRRMLPHRRLGNWILTKLLCLVARRKISDGQSGYRALSLDAARAAEVIHDYNYAQVLTLDLLGKGFRYLEVPIDYSFRTEGRSFVRLGRYLRHVIPAVHREVNDRSSSFV